MFEGACCQGYCHHSTPNPNPPPEPVTEVPRQPKLTTTSPKKPERKPTATAQTAAGKSKKKVVASVTTAATKPTTTVLVVPNQSPNNPLEEISDLIERLPLQACVEMTRRLLTSFSSLPQGQQARGLS